MVQRWYVKPWLRITQCKINNIYVYHSHIAPFVVCQSMSVNQSVISTTLFCPLGGVSLKFSNQTCGRWESAKRECRVNVTWQIERAHCLHRFTAKISRVFKKSWPPVGHREGHKVGHGLPHVLSTPSLRGNLRRSMPCCEGSRHTREFSQLFCDKQIQ